MTLVHREKVNDIQFTELTIRILFLFLPGIISTLIIDTLTTHRKKQIFNFLIHSYLIGILSYALLSIVVFIYNRMLDFKGQTSKWESTFLDSLLNSKSKINSLEVFYASIISVFLAILLVKIINNKYYYRLFNYLKVTRKHGEEDVWDFLLSSNEVEWINVRDKENQLIYQGAVRGYSEKDNKRELYLQSVKVYNEEGEELYQSSHVYFNFTASSNLIIEFYEGDEENE